MPDTAETLPENSAGAACSIGPGSNTFNLARMIHQNPTVVFTSHEVSEAWIELILLYFPNVSIDSSK
jgi:hypothetical protein